MDLGTGTQICPTSPFTISEPEHLEISNFMLFRNVVGRISKLKNCERVGQVLFLSKSGLGLFPKDGIRILPGKKEQKRVKNKHKTKMKLITNNNLRLQLGSRLSLRTNG